MSISQPYLDGLEKKMIVQFLCGGLTYTVLDRGILDFGREHEFDLYCGEEKVVTFDISEIDFFRCLDWKRFLLAAIAQAMLQHQGVEMSKLEWSVA